MAVLTISRQFGAGGRTLGKRVSQRLNYTLVDEDIIGMIAERAKVSNNWVRSIEKEAGGSLLKFMNIFVSQRYVNRILDDTRGYLDEEIYVSTLNEVITEIAKEGNCVVVGRGGQYILRDNPDTFHVLLLARENDRLQFMIDNYRLRPDQAKTVIRVREKRRRNLYRKFGKENFEDSDLYHLVLNMSKLSMDRATDIVCHLMEEKTA